MTAIRMVTPAFASLAFVVSISFAQTTSQDGRIVTEDAAPPAPASHSCDVTMAVREKPPQQPGAGPLGEGPWYVNDDRSIWAPALKWKAGKGEKVIWIRPWGKDLAVTGRRLDGPTVPLKFKAPCCYPWGFQVTGLMFPTEGCWEVTVKAGKSKLIFIIQVRPANDAAVSHAQPNKRLQLTARFH
jgi:hypothetical protein